MQEALPFFIDSTLFIEFKLSTTQIPTRNSLLLWIAVFVLTFPSATFLCLRQIQSGAFWFPLCLLAAFGLIYTSWDKVLRGPNLGSWVLAALAIAVQVLEIGNYLQPTIFAQLSFGGLAFVLAMSAWLLSNRSLHFAPSSLVRYLPFFIFWAIATQPLFGMLSSWFQSVSALIASQSLDLASISNRVHSNHIELIDRSWNLQEVLGESGHVALYGCMASLWIAWFFRSHALVPLYIVCALFWGMIADAAQILLVLGTHYAYGWDSLLESGWAVRVGGVITWILLFLSSDRIIRFLFQPVDSDKSQGVNPLVVFWNSTFRTMGQASSFQQTKKP